MELISKEELANRAKLLPETVNSLISLGVLKVVEKDGIEMITVASAKEILQGELGIEIEVEKKRSDDGQIYEGAKTLFQEIPCEEASTEHTGFELGSHQESQQDHHVNSTTTADEARHNPDDTTSLTQESTLHSPDNVTSTVEGRVGTVEILQDDYGVPEKSRVISILVERINSLSQENRWLKAQIEAQQRELENAQAIVSKQVDLIERLATAPRFPLLTRIFQALGLESENRSRDLSGK